MSTKNEQRRLSVEVALYELIERRAKFAKDDVPQWYNSVALYYTEKRAREARKLFLCMKTKVRPNTAQVERATRKLERYTLAQLCDIAQYNSEYAWFWQNVRI